MLQEVIRVAEGAAFDRAALVCRDQGTGLQKVAAVQLGAPTPRPKKRPRHLTKKIGGIIMDDTPLQPSDYESDTQGTECRLWNEGSQHAQTTKFAARFSEHRFSALPTKVAARPRVETWHSGRR